MSETVYLCPACGAQIREGEPHTIQIDLRAGVSADEALFLMLRRGYGRCLPRSPIRASDTCGRRDDAARG